MPQKKNQQQQNRKPFTFDLQQATHFASKAHLLKIIFKCAWGKDAT
jgi:hypothetical protein